MRSRLEKAKDDIVGFFESSEQKVFLANDLHDIFYTHHIEWKLAVRSTAADFVAFLLGCGLKRFAVRFAGQGESTCYTWGEQSLWLRLMALKSNSYFSYLTALQWHGLVDLSSKTLYLTQAHHAPSDREKHPLTQAAIDGAFQKPQRVTSRIAEVEGYDVRLTSGPLETDVIWKRLGTPPANVAYTSLERTLIDAVVRPVYAGGVSAVLGAFMKARKIKDFSAARLLEVLTSLELIYPYHQAVGFYLQRAGYPPKEVKRFQELPQQFDFYLTHAMAGYVHVPEWRLHVPAGL